MGTGVDLPTMSILLPPIHLVEKLERVARPLFRCINLVTALSFGRLLSERERETLLLPRHKFDHLRINHACGKWHSQISILPMPHASNLGYEGATATGAAMLPPSPRSPQFECAPQSHYKIYCFTHRRRRRRSIRGKEGRAD